MPSTNCLHTRFECGEQRVQRHVERIAVKAEKDEIRVDDPDGLSRRDAKLRQLQGIAPVNKDMKRDSHGKRTHDTIVNFQALPDIAQA